MKYLHENSQHQNDQTQNLNYFNVSLVPSSFVIIKLGITDESWFVIRIFGLFNRLARPACNNDYYQDHWLL